VSLSARAPSAFKNGLSVQIDDPVQTGAGFIATNNGAQYSVSPGALVITQGSSVPSNEPMLEYCYWLGPHLIAHRRSVRRPGAVLNGACTRGPICALSSAAHMDLAATRPS
jgi:hypothetical protein